MPNSNRARALGFAAILLVGGTSAAPANAQKVPQGFNVERLYTSAPGGGWFVMDALDMRGSLGGDMALTTGYARRPLHVPTPSGAQDFAVVSDQAFVDFGFALTYDRLRLYLNIDAPLVVAGQSGAVGDYKYVAPSVDPGLTPDTLSDARIGFDARLFGGPHDPLRLGASAQLLIPNGTQTNYAADGSYQGSNYQTDGTYRGMLRALVAGDLGRFTYAGQLGVHIRPRDDPQTPGGPIGSELLFGMAGGYSVPLRRSGSTVLVFGPEIFGETALRFGNGATGVEGLLTGRVEGTDDDGLQLRVKLGTGGGIDPNFGAPEWRFVFGLELFDHGGDRDHDGVSDSKDACPDKPGIKTHDPKTSGCPEVTPAPPR